MGCEFVSVPLQTAQDQYAFITRLNRYRLSHLPRFLVLQMQQANFLAWAITAPGTQSLKS